MRPIVALVEARPETIAEDYTRAVTLAGLSARPANDAWALAAGLDGARWRPGRTCPVWQVSGVLDALAGAELSGESPAFMLASVGAHGPGPLPAGQPWGDVFDRARVRDAVGAAGSGVPVRARVRLPALEATGVGPTVPALLRDKPLLALATCDLQSAWLIEGACAVLGRLVLGGHPERRRVPSCEVRAETVGLCRELFPTMGAVIDGTLWHVGPRGQVAARNVIIAGNDPVAVDAVALKLAGLDPRQVPWLRLCGERGFGVSDPDAMRLTGSVEWLDLDFELPARTFARRTGPLRWPGRLSALLPRRPDRTPHGPWAALHEDYRAGRASKAES